MTKGKSKHARFFLFLEIGTVLLALISFVLYRRSITQVPAYIFANVPLPRWDGTFPCVYVEAKPTSAPQIGTCATPVPMSKSSRMLVDRFETDLRRGKFILRQTDLSIRVADFEIPLTRTYTQDDWLPQNKAHAFGRNANHPFDIAPVGTRNPYTEQFLVLENGDFLFSPRVSKGTSYSDAIFLQTEIGNSFYKAITRWDGNGWLTQLQDGSTIHFPEAYNAKSLAQGAPTEMNDAEGNSIELIRDSQRNLREIRVPQRGSIQFAYDNQGRIVRAEDSRNNWTRYTYDPSGFLSAVIHSDGTERQYTYENGLLSEVRDEQKHLLLHNVYYNNNWLFQQTFGNGHTTEYRYDLASNHFYAKTVYLKLWDGSERRVNIGDCISEAYKRMR